MMNESNKEKDKKEVLPNQADTDLTEAEALFEKKASIIDIGKTFSESGDALAGDLVKLEGERRTRLTQLKKQLYVFIALLVAVAIFVPVYIFVIEPLTRSEEPVSEPIALVESSDEDKAAGKCESLVGDRILMFSQVTSETLQRIEVHNANGDYSFFRNGDRFDVDGAEGIGYSSTAFSSLVTYTGYPLSLVRVDTQADSKKLREYGLDSSNFPMWYRLTTTEGVQHTVYVGNKISTGGGYYARYEGRDAVYVLSASVGDILSMRINDYISPMLTTPTDASSFYNVSTFKLASSSGIYLQIDCPILLGEVTGTDSGAATGNEQTYFTMKIPTQYAVNTQKYIEILQKFVSLTGNEIVAFRLNDDLIEQYGFAQPWRELYFVYGKEENHIFFAKSPDPNVYYACSPKYDLIVTVNADDFDFLTWDVSEFIDRTLITHYITNISNIRLESDSVHASFDISVSTNSDGTPSIDSITEGNAKRSIDITNFRKYYRYLVTLQLDGVVKDQNPENLTCIATLTLTLRSGETKVFRFYPYSDRRCLYTVNGTGEFYILFDSVKKLISDTQKAMNNETVDYAQRA